MMNLYMRCVIERVERLNPHRNPDGLPVGIIWGASMKLAVPAMFATIAVVAPSPISIAFWIMGGLISCWLLIYVSFSNFPLWRRFDGRIRRAYSLLTPLEMHLAELSGREWCPEMTFVRIMKIMIAPRTDGADDMLDSRLLADLSHWSAQLNSPVFWGLMLEVTSRLSSDAQRGEAYLEYLRSLVTKDESTHRAFVVMWLIGCLIERYGGSEQRIRYYIDWLTHGKKGDFG